MSYQEVIDRAEWLMHAYHLNAEEAMEAAYYDDDPETWIGSRWEIK